MSERGARYGRGGGGSLGFIQSRKSENSRMTEKELVEHEHVRFTGKNCVFDYVGQDSIGSERKTIRTIRLYSQPSFLNIIENNMI